MSLTQHQSLLFYQEIPPITAESSMTVSATMTVAAVTRRFGAVEFSGQSEYISEISRLQTGALDLEVDIVIGDITPAIHISGAVLMDGTIELDPIDVVMERGGTANLAVSASLAPFSGRIFQKGTLALDASAELYAYGGYELRGELDLAVSIDAVIAGQPGVVGLLTPGSVNAVAVINGEMIIGGLADDSWRVSIDMSAASDGYYFGTLTPGKVNAILPPIQAGVIRSGAIVNMAASASMLAIAFDPSNPSMLLDISADMSVDAFVQIGSWTDLEATATFAPIVPVVYRNAIVGDSAPDGSEAYPPMTASAFIDLNLDGLVAGRPYIMRASAKMRVVGGINTEFQEGTVYFQGTSQATFAGSPLRMGEVIIVAQSEATFAGGKLLTSGLQIAGLSTVAFEGSLLKPGELIIEATGDVVFAAGVIRPAAVVIPAVSTFEANGGFLSEETGEVLFAAIGSLEVSGHIVRLGGLEIAITSTAEFEAFTIVGAAVDFSGMLEMSADGVGSIVIRVGIVSREPTFFAPYAYGGVMSGLGVRSRNGVAASLRVRASDIVFSES